MIARRKPVARYHWTILGIPGECYRPNGVDLCFKCVGRQSPKGTGVTISLQSTYDRLSWIFRVKRGGISLFSLFRIFNNNKMSRNIVDDGGYTNSSLFHSDFYSPRHRRAPVPPRRQLSRQHTPY